MKGVLELSYNDLGGLVVRLHIDDSNGKFGVQEKEVKRLLYATADAMKKEFEKSKQPKAKKK